jgi:hypothetical protein
VLIITWFFFFTWVWVNSCCVHPFLSFPLTFIVLRVYVQRMYHSYVLSQLTMRKYFCSSLPFSFPGSLSFLANVSAQVSKLYFLKKPTIFIGKDKLFLPNENYGTPPPSHESKSDGFGSVLSYSSCCYYRLSYIRWLEL